MAPRRTATALPPVSIKDINAELVRSNFSKALELASRLIELFPTDENRGNYVRVLAACVDGFLKQGKIKSATDTLKLAEQFALLHDSVRTDAAVLHAKTGEFGKALQLANVPRVLMHVADLCVRRNRADGAPAEVKADFPHFQQAVQHYEVGRDEPAKELLQKLGLASPFQQWKLLLRGLVAHAGGDTARAIENWQRLAPEYIPATLASPLRFAVEPEYRTAQPADAVARLKTQSETQASGGIAGTLRELQKITGRDQPLDSIWKPIAELMPKLRTAHPLLVPRFGRLLYHAIIDRGTPYDLAQYRKHFQPPPDDPQFLRMQALACESTKAIEDAVEHWQNYESWLAKNAPNWNAEMLARARAIVLHRIGCHVEDLNIADEAPAEIQRGLRKLLGEQNLMSRYANPDDYYRRSLDLAPDWDEPAYDLFDRYARQRRWPAAERVATDYLARRPDDEGMLERLVETLLHQKKVDERLCAAKRLLAVNPLNAEHDTGVSRATISAIRRHMIDGRFDVCDRLLAEASLPRQNAFPVSFGSFRAVLGRLRKRPDEVEAGEALARKRAEHRLAAPFQIVVDGLLAKLKPAQRKETEARLKAILAETAPLPQEVAFLYAGWKALESEGFEYRGQKTHGEKIAALAERSLKAAGSLGDYEVLVQELLRDNRHKSLRKMLPVLRSRFPNSPVFPFCWAATIAAGNPSYSAVYRAQYQLADATRLAKASDEPQYRSLLERIEMLEKNMGPLSGLGSIFGSPFAFEDFDDDEFDDEEEF